MPIVGKPHAAHVFGTCTDSIANNARGSFSLHRPRNPGAWHTQWTPFGKSTGMYPRQKRPAIRTYAAMEINGCGLKGRWMGKGIGYWKVNGVILSVCMRPARHSPYFGDWMCQPRRGGKISSTKTIYCLIIHDHCLTHHPPKISLSAERKSLLCH